MSAEFQPSSFVYNQSECLSNSVDELDNPNIINIHHSNYVWFKQLTGRPSMVLRLEVTKIIFLAYGEYFGDFGSLS